MSSYKKLLTDPLGTWWTWITTTTKYPKSISPYLSNYDDKKIFDYNISYVFLAFKHSYYFPQLAIFSVRLFYLTKHHCSIHNIIGFCPKKLAATCLTFYSRKILKMKISFYHTVALRSEWAQGYSNRWCILPILLS